MTTNHSDQPELKKNNTTRAAKKHEECPVCGKDIDCKTCITSGQDTCGKEDEA